MHKKRGYFEYLQSMFEPRNFAGALESYQKLKPQGNMRQTFSSWSHDMEGHAKKCAERCCELTNETTEHLNKVSTPCLDDHHD